MKIKTFPQANGTAVAPPGHEGAVADLPIAHGETDGLPTITSCWAPTPEELEEIKRTGVVWLTVLGRRMPAVYLNGHNPFTQEQANDDG